jgi:hypothetical protein
MQLRVLAEASIRSACDDAPVRVAFCHVFPLSRITRVQGARETDALVPA